MGAGASTAMPQATDMLKRSSLIQLSRGSPHARLSDDLPLARRAGIVCKWTQHGLVLWTRRNALELELNNTAALIWLLCNGQLTSKGVKETLKKQYPKQGENIETDVTETLSHLHAHNAIELIKDRGSCRPLLRVGFCNFWTDFDTHDNYFLWMLTHRFDVLLVDPDSMEADLVFYSTFPSKRGDAARVDCSRTLKVLFTLELSNDDLSKFDYAFCAAPSYRVVGQYVRLPLWSLYLDWESYKKSEASFSDSGAPSLYKPENVCAQLYDALFRGVLPEQHEPEPPPSLSTVAPHINGAGHRTPAKNQSNLPRTKLTIGMATYDDYDGVYFTVQAIRLYHPEVANDIEILVIDNNPRGACAAPLMLLENWVTGYRYFPYEETQGTTVKDLVFREARSPYVICIDCHVLLAPRALAKLIHYLDTHPECQDLLQGPLVYDDLEGFATHRHPEWSAGMYGVWATDERGKSPDHEPFEIPMQGMGLFACRKEAWLGFNPRFTGFGGEEWYIHEKFRLAGRRTLCLPFLSWLHRFNRPFGPPYLNTWADRIRNYFIGFEELGLETESIEQHFEEHLGKDLFERVKREIQSELDSPFFYFDAIYCVVQDSTCEAWEAVEEGLRNLGVLRRARRFIANQISGAPHGARGMTHRRILSQARKYGFKTILILEDVTGLKTKDLHRWRDCIGQLAKTPWGVCHFTGSQQRNTIQRGSVADLAKVTQDLLDSSYATAYNGICEKVIGERPWRYATAYKDCSSKKLYAYYHDSEVNQYIAIIDDASEPVMFEINGIGAFDFSAPFDQITPLTQV